MRKDVDNLPDLLQQIDEQLRDDPFGESRIDETLNVQHKASIDPGIDAPNTPGGASSSSGIAAPLAPQPRVMQHKLATLQSHLADWSLAVQETVLAFEFSGREWLRNPRDGVLSLAFVSGGVD